MPDMDFTRPQPAAARESQSGAFMDVVKEGRVAILIRGNKVETAVPGGTFGDCAGRPVAT